MKITEEITHVRQAVKMIERCQDSVRLVVNNKKEEYVEHLRKAKAELRRAEETLNRF